ncbi:MAG: transglycosylase SLT domain-containing protein [Clostridia bacterium]|nr:transglycosylase SLT domain-containing protein [Clostridia bacterium]
METNPNQRTRSRRADRLRQESGTAPSGELMQRTWQMPEVPAQPVQQAMPVQPAQRDWQMTPSAPAPRPKRQVTPTAVRNSTPKALQRPAAPVQSGWSMPDSAPAPIQRRNSDVPAALRRKAIDEPAPAEASAEHTRKKPIPGWLTAALTIMLLVVMALVAAQYLMQAYLVTAEEERLAAKDAILANYHVTEDDQGRRITWQDSIERYAAQYNLQPAFVAAVIRNESSFRTNAESSVGARGLMQLMPDTAEWIAGKLDDDSYTFDSMYDAETYIRYGCWYLGYLSEQFGGDPVLVCAAYHAGQGEVRSWLDDRSISPDGRTVPLDNVPISETRQYAGRVTQAYGIYQALLYSDEPLEALYRALGSNASALYSAAR